MAKLMAHKISALFTDCLSLLIFGAFAFTGCSGTSAGNSSTDPRVILSHVALGLPSSNFLLTLSATILPPTVSGTTLNADDVFLNGLTAYTSYNIPGATHMGGIDLINITIPTIPVRVSTTTFATSTINSLYVNASGVVTAVGSTSDSLATGWPAFLTQVGFSGGAFTAPTNTQGLLNTYAGTGITSWNGSLYTTSGTGGASTSYGLSVLNPTTLAQTASLTISDARALSYYYGGGTDLWVNSGGGNLYDINSSNAIAHTVAINGNNIAQSKSTVQVGKTMVLASEGDQGFTIICQADQKVLASVAAITVNGLASTLTVTNAVAAGPGLIFAADGEAGLYVYSMVYGNPTTSTCKSLTLTQIGIINLGSTTYSANNARYAGGSLFVATGLGGFNVITVTVLSPLLNANLDFM